jgi:mRNA-degrading endonuclease RelE of RelBE toxin-antitoxin system
MPDYKKASDKMEKVRQKQRRSIGKLGESLKNFFTSDDVKKKKKADSVNLDKSKVSEFKSGFFGRNK